LTSELSSQGKFQEKTLQRVWCEAEKVAIIVPVDELQGRLEKLWDKRLLASEKKTEYPGIHSQLLGLFGTDITVCVLFTEQWLPVCYHGLLWI
jgi:hypothetical protein